MLFRSIHNILSLESPNELIEFYTLLWQKYAPKNLYLEDFSDFTLPLIRMPLELFQGFCNYIKNNDKNFSPFKYFSFYISNNYLKIYNKAFTECKIEKIQIVLEEDIKKKNLKKFIDIIMNGSLVKEVDASFFYSKKTDDDAIDLFNSFKENLPKNIKRWKSVSLDRLN